MSDRPQSPHQQLKFSTEIDELASPADRLTLEAQEAATSSHVVRMIDFFFAFVLGQGVLRFRDTVSAPWDAPIPALLALVTLLYVVVRSFIGWHMAIEERRYRLYAPAVRMTELWRVYIDVAIVLVYAYMLNNAVVLQERPGHDLTALVWAFPLLFGLYAAWGKLRRVAWGEDAFKLRVLRRFCVGYIALALVYTFGPTPFSISSTSANNITLAIALLLMVWYRWINFWQGVDGRPTWPTLKPLKIEDESPPAADR